MEAAVIPRLAVSPFPSTERSVLSGAPADLSGGRAFRLYARDGRRSAPVVEQA
jgi:hypothetical protein